MESQTPDCYGDLMKDWAICNALGSSPIADGSDVDWADWGALPDELLELQPDLSSTAEEAGQLPDVDLLIALTETEGARSEEHTSELQSLAYLVCRLLLEKKKTRKHSS